MVFSPFPSKLIFPVVIIFPVKLNSPSIVIFPLVMINPLVISCPFILLSLNYELLKDIFNSSASKGEEIRVSSTSDLYGTDKFLKKSLWRIVK